MASQTHPTATPSGRSSTGRQRQPVGAYRSDPSLPASAALSDGAYTRLVVLVPDDAFDHRKLLEELSTLVTASVSEMVLVGLGQRRSTSTASRRLAELASVLEELPVQQAKQVIDAGSWAEAVHRVARPGDMIVCRADRPVEELARITSSPVHLLPGLQLPLATRLARALKGLLFNLFPLIVVAAFFWLQVQIDSQNTGLIRTLVLSMSVLVELGIIFVWSLFIR